MRVLDYALATDGGTQVIVFELDDAEKLMIGFDGRMDSPVSGKQMFIGSSPESSDTRLLPIGGTEEGKVISLMKKWLDQTQGFIRREALMAIDPSELKSQDLLDRLALEFILKVRSRDVA